MHTLKTNIKIVSHCRNNYQTINNCRCEGGALNGQRVVEFPVGGAARSLAAQGVAGATLWVRVEPRLGAHARNLTLWAFRVTRLPPSTNGTRLSAQVRLFINLITTEDFLGPNWVPTEAKMI